MKAVVFDMDGVLFDTEKLCMNCWVEIADSMGIPDMERVFRLCIGTNSADTEAIIYKSYGMDFPYEDYCKKSSGLYWKYIEENGVPVKKGVKDILEFLKDAGYKLALASSSKRSTVERELRNAGIYDYFSEIVTGDMVQHSKPEPDIYLIACEKLGVKPEEAYAIEDSFNGIRAAARAGMKPVMVPDLMEPDVEMKKLAIGIFDDLSVLHDRFMTGRI